MSILRQDSVFKTRLQDLKKNPKLEFERHGVSVEDDNDSIHPPLCSLDVYGAGIILSPETVNRQG